MIGDALDRMRSAANRRVEAELCAVRLCSLDADSYDTLGGRVEALEEKLKNGVPVHGRAADAGGRSATQGMAMSRRRRTTATRRIRAGGRGTRAPGKNEAAAPAAADWPHWPALLEALTGKINTGAHTDLKLSARGIGRRTARSLSSARMGLRPVLAKAEPTMKVIRAQAAALAGAPVKVKVREAGTSRSTRKEILRSMS